MLFDLLMEAFGTNWSRRWVRLRQALVVAVLLLVPRELVAKGLDWYVQRQVRPMVQQLRHLAPVLKPPAVSR